MLTSAKAIALENDEEIFNFIKENLYVAAVCDMLDTLGHRNQAMDHRLRPLLPEIRNCGFIGRARTLRWMEIDYVDERNPYGLEIEAIDSLKSGDVIVHSTDYTGASARWGELLSTVAKNNGAAGCVCDGPIRDCIKIIDMGFPVFYSEIHPADSKGRTCVMSYDVPVKCGGVLVQSGDLVFADIDGIVVIPKEIEKDVLILAQEKIERESLTRKDLLRGDSLRQVFNRYGIL